MESIEKVVIQSKNSQLSVVSHLRLEEVDINIQTIDRLRLTDCKIKIMHNYLLIIFISVTGVAYPITVLKHSSIHCSKTPFQVASVEWNSVQW